jgi:hypothetical protein
MTHLVIVFCFGLAIGWFARRPYGRRRSLAAMIQLFPGRR